MPAVLERWRAVPMILVMGTIFFLSHQSGDTVELPTFPGADKLAHLSIYGVLAATVIVACGMRLRSRRPAVVALVTVLVCLFYGLSDEFHQSFIPGRFVSGLDLLADGLWAALVSLTWYLRRRSRGRVQRGATGGGSPSRVP